MSKIWRIHQHDSGLVSDLSRSARIKPFLAQLLLARGITKPDQVEPFLNPKLTMLRDPNELPGCTEAAKKILAAVKAGKRILIYGDYDADGVTSTAILWRCLKLLDANVGYHIPHRTEEGYGVNDEVLRRLLDKSSPQPAELIVTVDCGITSIKEAETVREFGAEMIVTDHHTPGETLPDVAAIVHPRRPGDFYPFGELSGAGVAFKLAWAICEQASGAKRVSTDMRNFLLQATGLAALGTVADVVPLLDENRALVSYGITSLAERPSVGIKKLVEVSSVKKRQGKGAAYSADSDIAFSLAPRINAAGRLGQATLALELLITDREERAAELAAHLDQLNENRKTLSERIRRAADKQIKEKFNAEDDPAFVLADHDWNPGVIGIVAGRLAEKYHRPVVVIAWDKFGMKPGVGSARSVPNFNLVEGLSECERHLVSYGGHAAAAGLKITEENLDAFREEFCEIVAHQLADQKDTEELRIDAEGTLCEFTFDSIGEMESMAPFGEGNRRPLLCASGVNLVGPPKFMGKTKTHLSLTLAQHEVRLRAIAFGAADWAEPLEKHNGPIDVAFHPLINEFAGRQSVELQLIDWRPSRSAS